MLDFIPLILVFLTGMGAGIGIWWIADTLESRCIEYPYFEPYPDVTPEEEHQ